MIYEPLIIRSLGCATGLIKLFVTVFNYNKLINWINQIIKNILSNSLKLNKAL